jgi:omega-6 fatty acid desaturase (delta-12 desaturase)
MTAPHASLFRDFNPVDRMGWVHLALNFAFLGAGVALAASAGGAVTYIIGQLLLAVGFAQSFVILHEAGHRTMFRNRRMNDAVGVLSGVFALIPYATWQPVHNRHHRYTGWQDLDATTESLTPRELSGFEKAAVNIAWRFWLPLFSIIYRIQNYWRVSRIAPFLPEKANKRRLTLLILLQVAGYGALIWFVGFSHLMFLVGPGLFVSLMGQDLLILSQHTGMPTNMAQGHHVDPFPPSQQEEFTRSVRLPRWLSWVLLHFDAHELHHLYPAVPGYRLRQIDYDPPNEVNMAKWVREVKTLSGTQFLFGWAERDPRSH